MKIDMYDEDDDLIQDEIRREKFLLSEETDRIVAFLEDVKRDFDIENQGVGSFSLVVSILKNIRAKYPDRARDAGIMLNRAAAIEQDVKWHLDYIRKMQWAIDTELYLG